MKTDWIAELFRAMRENGEDVSIVYGYKRGADAEPQWFELPHDEFDGVSGLAKLLRAEGLRAHRLPAFQGEPLTFSRALRGLFAVMPTLQIRQRQWRQFDAARPVSFRPVSERLAWHVFDEEQTAQIGRAAKAAGVTVNTYLLFHLDAAVVSAQLTKPASSRRWMIPVNLRGAVTRPTKDAPCIAFHGADLADGGSPSELQTQIARLKARNCHWGVWAALHAGNVIGAQGMRWDLRNREKKNHGWTGLFSNLGAWEIPGSGSWIFCPAIWRAHPIGAGCITMNGRMALTLQLHDAFGLDLRTAYAVLDAWTQACVPEAARDISTQRRAALRVVECG
jgi:hypothetical protein